MIQTLPNEAKNPSFDLLRQGEIALQAGDYKGSLSALLEAYTLNPDSRDIQVGLLETLGVTSGYQLPKPITDALANSAIENNLNIQALATVLDSQIEADPSIETMLEFLENTPPGNIQEILKGIDFDTLLQDQLFLLVCSKATIISPKIEQLLCLIRRHFLGEWQADASSQPFFLDKYPEALAVVACQAFNNEFIYDVSAPEIEQIDTLQASILADLKSAHPFELVILAAYKPLWQTLKECSAEDLQYLIDQSPQWVGCTQLVWKVQFMVPLQETIAKQQLNVLTPIDESFSKAMAEQYEKHPYPRWQSTKTAPHQLPLSTHISARFPYFDASEVSHDPADILFAGCGTGEQIVRMNSSIVSKNILAVDLSLNSLGYAAQKSKEFGLGNVHFGQADILAVKDWDASFDLIVCTGVLHHMEDPSRGLAALLELSKPNTLFFLALYSERGRAPVLAARELIKKHSIPDTIEGMRQFRKEVRLLPDNHPVKPITNSREFYSTSGLHDFVFNSHELRTSPLELKQLLDQHGLEFIGFDIPRGDLIAEYKARFPQDPNMTNLENWDAFEKDNPTTFKEMMQFWCIKKR